MFEETTICFDHFGPKVSYTLFNINVNLLQMWTLKHTFTVTKPVSDRFHDKNMYTVNAMKVCYTKRKCAIQRESVLYKEKVCYTKRKCAIQRESVLNADKVWECMHNAEYVALLIIGIQKVLWLLFLVQFRGNGCIKASRSRACWCQFHQHYTRAFFVRKFRAKLFWACSEG